MGFVSSVYKLESLQVHYIEMSFNFALMFTCNCIWCIDTTKTPPHKYLALICSDRDTNKFYKIVALFAIGFARVMLDWLFIHL